VAVDSTGESLGLRDGDKIVSIDGVEIETFRDISLELLLGEAGHITVKRDGELVDISVSDEQKGEVIAAKTELVSPRFPYVAGGFVEGSASEKSGLQEGDSLVGLNGEPLYFFDQYAERIPTLKNQT